MTAAQLKAAEILSPLVGEYLATKLSARLPAVLADQLAAEIRSRLKQAGVLYWIEEAKKCRTVSGSVESPDTQGMSGN